MTKVPSAKSMRWNSLSRSPTSSFSTGVVGGEEGGADEMMGAADAWGAHGTYIMLWRSVNE